MNKHTPGPWYVSDTLAIWGKTARLIASCADGRLADPSPESRANATLIAAAPDLLASLQEVLDHTPEPHAGDARAILQRARAAIAKATGGQP